MENEGKKTVEIGDEEYVYLGASHGLSGTVPHWGKATKKKDKKHAESKHPCMPEPVLETIHKEKMYS